MTGARILFVVVLSLLWNGGSIVGLWALGFFELDIENPFLQSIAPAVLVFIAVANVPLINWALYVGDRGGNKGAPW
ncbi:hypothetical protein [Primorskyibacter sedentarius]|uniref:hypothetical protein n=1 Tax=Primorskyibacter sedentarius TaxID=745311 RepID=UPI003EC02277